MSAIANDENDVCGKQSGAIPEQPNFIPGTQIERPSLVVDGNGRTWWVDPYTQTVDRAVAE